MNLGLEKSDWYYAEGQETVGPVSEDQLISLLRKKSRPTDVLVWQTGFQDWRVGELPQLLRAVDRPPPLPKTETTRLSDTGNERKAAAPATNSSPSFEMPKWQMRWWWFPAAWDDIAMREFAASLIVGVFLVLLCVGQVRADLVKAGLGLTFYNPDPEDAPRANLTIATGAEVADVEENGPADRAGIERGDTVVRIDNAVINRFSDLQDVLSRRKPGEVVLVTIARDGTNRTFSIVLEARKKSERPKSWMRGAVSARGHSNAFINLRGTAILRILALPVDANCKPVEYEVSVDKGVLTKGSFYPAGWADLSHLTADQLTVTELLLPAGEYQVRTHSNSTCRYAITRAVRYLSDFGYALDVDSELPPMMLRRDAALVREVIRSGLFKYVDVSYLQAVFLDKLWGEGRAKILKQACKVLRHDYGVYGSNDDVRNFAKKRFELVLKAAYGNYAIWSADKERDISNPNRPLPWYSREDACQNVDDLILAQDAKRATHPRIFVDLDLRHTQGDHVDTPMTSQVVVSKLERIIHELYGYSATDIAMEFGEGNCQMSVRDGVVRGGMCLHSGYASAPIPRRESSITNVSSATLTSKLDPSTVEAALRTVVGSAPKIDFLVQNENLVQVKIYGTKNLIIKSLSYWELIYLDIVPAKNLVHAIIEPSYASGIGDAPPPDEAFKGNTEVEFPSETRAVLQKMVNAIAYAQTEHH